MEEKETNGSTIQVLEETRLNKSPIKVSNGVKEGHKRIVTYEPKEKVKKIEAESKEEDDDPYKKLGNFIKPNGYIEDLVKFCGLLKDFEEFKYLRFNKTNKLYYIYNKN